MRTSTVVVVGVVGLVAVAALVSSLTGGARHAGPPAAAASPPSSVVTPLSTATIAAGAVPLGDVRRLPKPRAGDLHGTMLAWSDPDCAPKVLDLGRQLSAGAATVSPACFVWTSPNDGVLSLEPPGNEQVYRARPIRGRAGGTGLTFVPNFDPQLVTVSDNGSAAVCDGARVLFSTAGRARVVRTFESSVAGVDERCITGALGTHVVRLAPDRRRLLDVASGRTVLRLAQRAPRPVIGIAASSDGYVAVADSARGGPAVTVFGPTGAVAHARRSLGRSGTANKLLLATGGDAVGFETPDGWTITSLTSGAALSKPGNTLVWDVAFAPDGRTVALGTPVGIVFAALPGLVPRWRIGVPSRAIGWFAARLFPRTPTTPL